MMVVPKFLIKKGFGVLQLGFEIFEWACQHCKFLFLLTDEDIEEGLTFYRTREGRRFRVIFLRRDLSGIALIIAAWHEFWHAYLDHYGVRLFARGSESRYERQAEDLALCCAIPTLWVRSRTREDLLSEGFTNEHIDRRKAIYDSTGI